MQTVSKRVLGGFAFTSIEKLLVRGLSFITFFVVVNNISLKDYGLLQLLLTLSAPAAAFAMLGMERLIISDASVYRAQEAYGAIKRILKEYVVVTVALLLFIFVVAWFLRILISGYYDINLTYYYSALVCLVIGQVSMNFMTVVFESHEKFQYSLLTKSTEAVVRSLIIFSFFFWFGFSLQTIFWAYIIGKLVAAVVSIPLALSVLHLKDVYSEKGFLLLKIIRQHGKWEMVGHVIKIASDNTAPWIINFLVSTEGVAIYAFVLKINSLVTSLLPVRGVLFPILSHSIERSKKLAIAIASKVKKYMLIIYGVFYILIFLFIGVFISKFTPQYTDATIIVRVAMLHLFIDVLTLGQSVVFYALKQQKRNFGLIVYGVSSTILTQILFTYLWGVMGLFISWLFVGVSLGILREIVLRRKLQFTLFHLHSILTFDEYDKQVLRLIKGRIAFWKRSVAK